MSETPTAQAFTDHSLRLAQIANPQSEIVHFPAHEPLKLDCGVELAPFSIAYQTYGVLNAAKSNVVLVCHALTGDQHVANIHPVTGKPGWWDTMVGPGKPIDTNRYFVLCANVIGGCMGSTGPSSINPATGRAYGLDFPVITVRDMVRAQARLLDHLGIADVLSVLGGSMGGMQVLEWAATYKDRVFSAVPIACAARHSSQNIAFHEVGRQAVMADPEWCQGRYLDEGRVPAQGSRRRAHGRAHHLHVRRRAAHEVRPQSPGSREGHVRLRRRLPGGELSAPPGLELRTARYSPRSAPPAFENGPTNCASCSISPVAVREYPWPASAARNSGSHATAACPIPLIADGVPHGDRVDAPPFAGREHAGIDLHMQMPVRIPCPGRVMADHRRLHPFYRRRDLPAAGPDPARDVRADPTDHRRRRPVLRRLQRGRDVRTQFRRQRPGLRAVHRHLDEPHRLPVVPQPPRGLPVSGSTPATHA